MDAGNLFGGDGDDEEIQRGARTAIAGMDLMGYDALNIGASDLILGHSFLEMQKESASFSFLSANLMNPDSKEHPFAAYTIKETGHFKVGIIGLVSSKLFQARGLIAQDPIATLQAILPELTSQVHFVIVLAQMSSSEAVELVNDVEGIDVIVVSGDMEKEAVPSKVNGALFAQCNHWGMTVGELRLVGNTAGKIVDHQWNVAVLDDHVADDPGMVELVQRYGE